MAFIHSIGLAKAPYKHAQQNIFEFVRKMYQIPTDDLAKIQRLYERSEIATRYACIQDFSLPLNQWTFFSEDGNASLEKRMKTFFEIAPPIGAAAVKACLQGESIQQVTHLITVSCTGMSAPGLDIQLMQILNLKRSIHRTSVNFMGCYAAIHALKQANAICLSQEDAQVLIVDVELCTLHFQSTYTMDNVTSSLLFADGAAATIVSNTPGKFAIQNFYSEIAFEGYKDMAWDISANGFLMRLSNYIPDIIAANIHPMLLNSLAQMKLTKADIQHWAVHPGGKKILYEIEKALELEAHSLNISKEILRDFGNMSSVTLFYVLQKMQTCIQKENENIYAVAFGPGLTIETMLLRSC